MPQIEVRVNDLNDCYPEFDVNGVYETSISESLGDGAPGLTVTATDGDDSFKYRQVTYNPITDDPFAIDPDTGAITVSLGIGEALDYEDKDEYVLSIVATDGERKISYFVGGCS